MKTIYDMLGVSSKLTEENIKFLATNIIKNEQSSDIINEYKLFCDLGKEMYDEIFINFERKEEYPDNVSFIDKEGNKKINISFIEHPERDTIIKVEEPDIKDHINISDINMSDATRVESGINWLVKEPDNYVYKGDIIIGRVTSDLADFLHSIGYANIITIEEALKIARENGRSLNGELGKFEKEPLFTSKGGI